MGVAGSSEDQATDNKINEMTSIQVDQLVFCNRFKQKSQYVFEYRHISRHERVNNLTGFDPLVYLVLSPGKR